jgi:hypothetical protein
MPKPYPVLCPQPWFAKVFTMRLEVIVLVALLIIVVWSLITVGLLSMWRVNVEDQLPANVIWLVLGIIGFSTVLIFLSTYILRKAEGRTGDSMTTIENLDIEPISSILVEISGALSGNGSFGFHPNS